MWDRFVDALVATFCQPAFALRRNPAHPGVCYRYTAYPIGPTDASWLLSYMASRGSTSRPDIPPFDVGAASRHRLLFASDVGSLVRQTVRLLRDEPAPDGAWLRDSGVGVRPTTNDLLRNAALMRTLGTADAFRMQRVREAVLAHHAPPLRRFLELFAYETAENARLQATMFVGLALAQLTPEEACDDVFRVRCHAPALPLPLAASNAPPNHAPSPAHHALSSLDRRLAELFDHDAQVRAEPTGRARFLLYASYFGGLNVVLLSELLNQPVRTVAGTLFRLWRRLLPVL